MGLGSWLGRESAAAGNSGFRFTSWPDAEREASRIGWIGREQAAGLPGIGRAVALVSDVLGAVKIDAVRYSDEPNRPIVLLNRPPLFRDPDPLWHDRTQWTAAICRDLMWDGNAFADRVTHTDRLGYPLRLPLIPPHLISWQAPHYVEQATAAGGPVRLHDPDDLLHIAVGADSGHRMGKGILHLHQDQLRLIAAVERATFVVMRDGKPAGLLTSDVDMTDAELAEVKQGFIKGVARDGIGALVRAEFARISWSAQDLTLIPAREHNLRAAADITGVPGYLIGVPAESRVYSNMETEWASFVKTSVQRYAGPLAGGLTRCLPRGQSCHLGLDELSRPDAATRWANHRTAVEIGAMTVDEVRQAEGMGPRTGTGDGSAA